MKHIKKWLIWTWLPVMLLLWLLTPPSNSPWVKHTVFLVTITMQGLSFQGTISRRRGKVFWTDREVVWYDLIFRYGHLH